MVAVTPGAVCAVAALAVLCFGADRPLLAPDTSWPNYALTVAISGAPIVRYPLADFAPDVVEARERETVEREPAATVRPARE